MPPASPNQPPLYAGTCDCAKKTVAKEGFRGFYKGETQYLASLLF